MDVAVVSRLLTLLALSALALAAAGLVQLTTRWRVPLLGSTGAAGVLTVAWLIVTTATAGSLYYSEIAGYPPCELCWYQRIAMYPLVLVLGVAALRRASDVWRYVLPLAAVGLSVSTYHYLIQHVPDLGPDACSLEVPCTSAWVWEFGFVSIPFMAGAGFLATAVLMLLLRKDPT